MAQMPPLPNIKIPPGGPAGLRLLGLTAAGIGGIAGAYKYGLYNVDGGHRAIIFNKVTGVKEDVKGEGTHLKWPFFENPVIFSVRAKPSVWPSLTGSRDLQMVEITLRILSRPDPMYLPTIYRTLGIDWEQRVMPSIVQEVLKSVVAQFNASQLITQREQVSQMISRALTTRARDFHIVLEDVSIKDLTFGRDYTRAVESKQVAQQEAERARFIVEKAKQDKKSAIIRAEGEARSAQMIGDAMKNNAAFVQLRRIEAARQIASVVQRSANRVYLEADTLQLNLGAVEQEDLSPGFKARNNNQKNYQ